MRILFDTNIVLDVLLERSPFVQESSQLVNAVESQVLTGLLGATTITTIHYLVARERNVTEAIAAVQRLLRLFEVAPVGRVVLEDALEVGFDDYEDAILHEAARHARAGGVVTRNVRDFSQATLAVYAPTELLQAIRQQ